MKLITLTFSIMFSFSSLAASVKPMPINLIRLYQKLPSERRMIAGYKETKMKDVSKTSMYLDDLREKLKTTNGKIRL